jgi:hypothetical protein
MPAGRQAAFVAGETSLAEDVASDRRRAPHRLGSPREKPFPENFTLGDS